MPINNLRTGKDGNMKTFWLAKQAQMAGSGRILGGAIGDSTIMGNNVIGTGFVGAAPFRLTDKVADNLTGRGLKTNKDIAFSHQGMSTFATQLGYDTRLMDLLMGWAFSTEVSISGNAWREPSPNIGALTANFAGIADTLVMYYLNRSSAHDSMNVLDGMTVVGTTSTIGTAALVRTSYALTGRASNKTVGVQRANVSAQPIDIVGFLAQDSQTPAFDFINLGRSGAKISVELVSNLLPWSPLTAYTVMGFHVAFVAGGANDLAAGVTATAFKNALRLILNALQAGGTSVVLVNQAKGAQPTYGTAEQQAAYTTVCYELSREYDIPLIDEDAVFVDWVTASAKGYFSDSIHPSNLGTEVRAGLYADLLMAV